MELNQSCTFQLVSYWFWWKKITTYKGSFSLPLMHVYFLIGFLPQRCRFFFHGSPTLLMAQGPILAPWSNDTAAGSVQCPTALPCPAAVPAILTPPGPCPSPALACTHPHGHISENSLSGKKINKNIISLHWMISGFWSEKKEDLQ